jgi:RNA polymerase sigma-70 factor, ECF subfamily
MTAAKERIQSELLITRYLRGDDQAFTELVDLWETPLLYYIRRFVDTEDDAWDAMQEVWLTVSRKVRKLRDRAAFPAWLYKLAHSRAIDHTRKSILHRLLSARERFAEESGDQGMVVPFEPSARDLHWGLGQLSRHHREVLLLHFLQGFSLAEISDIVNAPIGTVKSRLHYAKKGLRDILEEEESRHE